MGGVEALDRAVLRLTPTAGEWPALGFLLLTPTGQEDGSGRDDKENISLSLPRTEPGRPVRSRALY
jgi:hypothetical protein